jgi:hypothetical protein
MLISSPHVQTHQVMIYHKPNREELRRRRRAARLRLQMNTFHSDRMVLCLAIVEEQHIVKTSRFDEVINTYL